MIDTRLIFIDGIPGSGKSTTAQQLCHQLLHDGCDAEWFYEHDSTHPIYTARQLEEALASGTDAVHEILGAATGLWKRWASTRKASGPIAILESTLFQLTAGAQLLVEWDRDAIVQYALSVQEAIAALHPVLIYFVPEDVEGALKAIVEKRGDDFDRFLIDRLAPTPYGQSRAIQRFDQVMEFFQECRAVTDSLYSQLPIRKIEIDTSGGDWDAYRRSIADFLDMPRIESGFPPDADPTEYTGVYHEPNLNHEWTVGTDGAQLCFDNGNKTKILHKQGDVFCVEGVCVELTFVRDAHGIVKKIECGGHLTGEDVIETVWHRV